MKKYFYLPAFIFTILVFFSCTRKPPEIYQYHIQLNFMNDITTGRIYEKMSFFLNVFDPDGFEDLDKVFLIHDKEELYWEIDPQKWYRSDINGEIWIGSNGIRMPDFSDFPSGEYRIVLQDISGEYDEKTYELKKTDVSKASLFFPKPEIKDRRLVIRGDSPLYSLWVYDRSMNFIPPAVETPRQGFDLQKVILRKKELSEGFYYFLYIFDNEIRHGLISGPFSYENK